jgi:beta-phosphoglucomutase-like phosphatase (HAD superfamily)
MISVNSRIQAILFDLDGVITNTAEYHYQAWQALADAEGLPFDRQANEPLCGVSRPESLNLLLAGHPIDEQTADEWIERQNLPYPQLLQQVTSADLLADVVSLLAAAKAAALRLTLFSGSRNATTWQGAALFLAAADALELPPGW